MNGIPATSAEPLTEKADAPPTGVRWRILALLFAYSFMSWFNRVSMSVAGDEYLMRQFHISKPDMGVVYSALLFAYALCMTPGGWFIDRFGPWTALVLMGLGSALFGALTGVLGWVLFSGVALWWGLIVVRAVMGVFTAPIYPASARVVASWFPFPHRARANGLVLGAALVGIASTFVGFGTLIDLFGWETAFVITGSVTALLALAWTAYARSHPTQHPSVNQAELRLIFSGKTEPPAAPAGHRHSRAADWLVLLRNRSLVLLTLSYAAVGYFEYLFYFWIRHYFEEQLRLPKGDARLAATVANLGMAVGMFAGGWLADFCMRRYGYRLGRALVPVVGMIASALFLLLGLCASEPAWVVAWFTLAMASVGACEGPMWATAIELGGSRAGTSAGIFNTGGNAGGIVAPVVTPLVGEAFGWGSAISLGSAVCLVGVCLWFWIDPNERCPEEG
jgi:MFS family permease